MQPFCSIIIPTIGRAELTKAISSVTSQKCSGPIEVIVVNDSGVPLAEQPWQQNGNVTVITTQRQERCVARNTGAAIARGQYLWFLDDDDYMLPDALETMFHASQEYPEAVWISGTLLIVDEFDTTLAAANARLSGNCSAQVVGGAWIPLQASLIRQDSFFSVGGFNPAIIGTEDQDLGRRIALIGKLATVDQPVSCLSRGANWTTSTSYSRAPVDTRRSRDDILAQPNALFTLWSSSKDSYWQGRIVKVFLSTIQYNLNQRRLFGALSRLWGLILFNLLSYQSWLIGSFWEGIRAEHVPGTLHFIIQGLELNHTYDSNQPISIVQSSRK